MFYSASGDFFFSLSYLGLYHAKLFLVSQATSKSTFVIVSSLPVDDNGWELECSRAKGKYGKEIWQFWLTVIMRIWLFHIHNSRSGLVYGKLYTFMLASLITIYDLVHCFLASSICCWSYIGCHSEPLAYLGSHTVTPLEAVGSASEIPPRSEFSEGDLGIGPRFMLLPIHLPSFSLFLTSLETRTE